MKRIAFSFTAFLLSLSFIGNTAFAEEEIPPSEDLLEEIEIIANESDYFELVNLDELPEKAPLLHFDTLEDFEKAVKGLEEENNSLFEPSEAEFVSELFSFNDSFDDHGFSPMATTTTVTDRLRVGFRATWNPLLTQVRPLYLTVDLRHTYTGSGSTKTFSRVNNITSYSPFTFPSDWKQTSYDSVTFLNSRKTVQARLLGYHLLGISIGGQGIGARVNDTMTFRYNINGSKTITEYK